jgi:hypothetical protein
VHIAHLEQLVDAKDVLAHGVDEAIFALAARGQHAHQPHVI